ncbi:MAG: DNA replication/repair protein RecF [Bowdeniella nasicola]|nr:DNA replication/repair protein RecF [Bowdeniella nasicola]
MFISHLALDNFRSYEHVVVELAGGANAFIGLNGQGKTNLVEAIAYLATFTSHRVAADTALVRAGSDAAVVRAKVSDGERSQVLEVEILAGRANRARLNRAPVRPRELLGIVHCVVFAPEDLALVKGDPSERRRFLDDVIVQFTPRLAGVKSDYDKVVRQRSALLKSALGQRRAGRTPDLGTLDVWDAQVADLGGQLIAARTQLVEELRPYVAQAYHEVSNGQSEAGIAIKSSLGEIEERAFTDVSYAQAELARQLAEGREREITRGVTLVGPHRDDLILTLGDLPARHYASHGESWSFALALKLASYELLKERDHREGHSGPILILDDVFAELDTARRTTLATMVHDADQVFITAAVPEDVPAELKARRYLVHESTVERDDAQGTGEDDDRER